MYKKVKMSKTVVFLKNPCWIEFFWWISTLYGTFPSKKLWKASKNKKWSKSHIWILWLYKALNDYLGELGFIIIFRTNNVNSGNCAVEAACLVVLKRSIVFTTFHYYAFIRWFGRPSSLWINSSFKLKKMPQWTQKLFEISTFNCCLCIHC